MSRRLAGVAALLAALLLASSVQASDIRRIEAVGSVPIVAGQRTTVGPKEAAIDAALREAVHRVAHDFLMDADPDAAIALTPGPSQQARLREALGRDMVRYTKSFRILEDRGEGPALFVEQTGAETEYVVIVEVQVDAGKVEGRLVERGLIASRAPLATAGIVRLEVEGLDQYAAYEQLRELLKERMGARSVQPLELERGRSVLAVETALGPADLLHRLLALAPPNMQILPLTAEPDSVRLSVVWTPPAEADSKGDFGAVAAPGRSGRGRR